MSETSISYTLASTSTTVAENEMVLLADDIKKYDMTKLINFLQEQGLGLSKTAIKILENLKKVLKKYDIDENGIGMIRQFLPAIYKLKDEEEKLQQCIKKIKHRLGNIRTLLADSNETIRCEYILAILHASLYIVKRITNKELTLASQLEVVSEENRVSCTSKNPLNIRFTESALEESSEEERELYKNMKQIMSSELDLLKQCITELEAKNDKLEAENAELWKENTEIHDLRFKLTELKHRNAETLRSNAEYNKRCDAEIVKLRVKNVEFRDRLTKVEQNQSLIDNTSIDNIHTSNNNSSNFVLAPDFSNPSGLANSGADHYEKLLQKKEMDIFLDEEDKKIIASQDSSSDTAYVSETVNNNEKSYELEINEITNCTSSEIFHETEVIEDIVNSAVNSNTINDQTALKEIEKTYPWNMIGVLQKIQKESGTSLILLMIRVF
ncbi:9482_t:CDS:2 [Cetraspora pellucida]|uniref:9482_t:CDS:1 n=1 Tax=Cetraspora pellucida TaxID=1433469 RepID=A0ACA9M3R9_9GLOM|nr:9482_t:CDS:2 [Cetraspora pellucida]